MQNGLNIHFVTVDQFNELDGVDPKSTAAPVHGVEGENITHGDYGVDDAVLKQTGTAEETDPSYTTLASACGLGFLIANGEGVHSHMPLHLSPNKVTLEEGQVVATEDVRALIAEELPHKYEEFFAHLDKWILSEDSNYQSLDISLVLGAGISSIESPEERSEEDLMITRSEEIKNLIQNGFEKRLAQTLELASNNQVSLSFSKSVFWGQKLIASENEVNAPLTSMHYDPKSNILSINARRAKLADCNDLRANFIESQDALTGDELNRHYSEIKLGDRHSSPEAKEAMKLKRIEFLTDQSLGNKSMREGALTAALNHAFTRANIKVPQPAVILDMACGPCPEAKALVGFFGGSEEGTQLTGIDYMEPEITVATELNLDNPNTNFIQGDATNLNSIDEVPQEANVVSIRHQFVSSSPDIWQGIFQQGLERLNEDGVMVLTSYTPYEHNEMLEVMERLGAEIVFSGENPGRVEIPINHPEDRKVLGIDGVELKDGERAHYSHVAIIKKPPPFILN